ncbi:NuoI/complex I 23 kDa subunit family protein [Desulfosporosinus youngiae]|uniref:NADH-quinone oxidoreductase, chain I n=1 Tax=Desulfosporosinus youngiae DSM 17734 TaxID=768710 RepID=H5XYC6_9FIRM|nr:NADH-quinone oxidoreductase subunit I [Desulfosporosinus youngiae]EHQ91405.1 NADH-quinone oxidoreductase, chain I [Desulfosporosinus youngiae DSM 17734]
MFGKGLLQGLGITLKRMVGPNITEFYPEVKPTLPTKVRSSMGLQPDKCISCNMCAMACPNSVIKLTSEKNESNKKVLKSYHMNVGRCLFCGMCTEVCPTKALTVTQEFENSIFEPDDLIWDMMQRAERKGQVK